MPTRRRLLVVAAALAPLLIPSGARAADADHPACRATPRILAVDGLTIFGVRYRDQGGGVLEYACRGRRARSLLVGSEDDNYGGRTQAYAYDGARFLAAHDLDIGEGGGDADLRVFDLKTRHTVGFYPAVEADTGDPPPFRVTAEGGLVTQQDDGVITYFAPGHPSDVGGAILSTPGTRGSEVALVGTTAYWTEDGKARSAQIAGAPTPVENDVVAHVDVPRPSRACEAQAGTTLAGTARVRVFTHGGRRFACRATGVRRAKLPPGDVRIAADRWVLVRGRDGTLTLLDGLGRERTRQVSGTTSSTLLADGTLAWIDGSGALWRQAASASAPEALAPATDSPTALASSKRTIYWTASGGLAQEANTPHR